MTDLVPVRPVATAAQLAQYLLSSGYMQTPKEYLNDDEVQQFIQDAVINASSKLEPSTEINIGDVLDIFGLKDNLQVIEELSGSDWNTLMGSLTMTCAEHPTACIVTSGDTALIIAGYDGTASGDESRFVTLVSNSKQQSLPTMTTVDSEYDIALPHLDKPYTGFIVESSSYGRIKKKLKGKEEEYSETTLPVTIKKEVIEVEEEDVDDGKLLKIEEDSPEPEPEKRARKSTRKTLRGAGPTTTKRKRAAAKK